MHFINQDFDKQKNFPLVPIIQAGNGLPFDVISQRTVFYNLSVGKIEQSKKDLKAKMKSFENFEMPENRAERDLTLEDLNDNLNKKAKQDTKSVREATVLFSSRTHA